MTNPELKDFYARMEANGALAPIGECAYCDRVRETEDRTFPSHKAYSFCRSYSGGRSHCTCDTCF